MQSEILQYNRVIVLGGLGFIGSQLIAQLLLDKIDIICIDKSLPQLVNIPYQVNQYLNQKLKHFQIDLSINSNVEKLWKQLEIGNGDIVVNCAAETRWGMLTELYVQRVQNLSTYCAQHSWSCKVTKFIEISHSYVYGYHSHLCKEEETQDEPMNFFGQCKKQAEQEIMELEAFNYTIIRPSIVYGPGDTGQITKRILISLIYKFLNEEQKLLWTGDLKLNTVHVYDVVRLIIECMHNKKSYRQVYNVSSPQDTTMQNLYSLIGQITGSEFSFAGRIKSFFVTKMGLKQILNEMNAKHLITFQDLQNFHMNKKDLTIDLALYDEEVQQQQISLDGSKITRDLKFQYQIPNVTTQILCESLKQSIEYGLLPDYILQLK